MPFRTCDHLKADGVYCSSPAVRDQRYCYFHLNARARRVQHARDAQEPTNPCLLHIPILDNLDAVQEGLQQVVDALADNRIQNRRAALLLFALRQAANRLTARPEWKGSRPEVEADQPLCALEVNSLWDQYQLPFDVDLDGPPDFAAAAIASTAGLPLDARNGQTQQPRLSRVPARPAATRDTNDNPGSTGSGTSESGVPIPPATTKPAPQTAMKSPPEPRWAQSRLSSMLPGD